MNPEERLVAARAAVAVAGIACAVGSTLVIGEAGVNGIVAAVLGVLAAVAVLRLPGPGSLGVGAASAGSAMIVLGYHVFDPKNPPSASEALVGIGVPSAARYAAWLIAGVAVVLGVVGWLLTRRRATAGFTFTKATAVGAAAAVVLVVVAVPAGAAIADGTQDRFVGLGADRASTEAPPPAADNGSPTWHQELWELPRTATYSAAVRAVPGRGVVVRTENGEGFQKMVRVYDARTGHERWHYKIVANGVYIDAHDSRVLVVNGVAGVVFDLFSGNVVGAVRLPALAEGVGPWQPLSALPASADTIPLIGRTAVIGSGGHDRRPVLAIDVVDLTTSEVDPNPGSCKYAVPDGIGADRVDLIRFDCQRPARLELTGSRLLATVALPVPATARLTQAQATDRGALLGFSAGPEGDPPSLLLGVVAGRPDPVIRLEADIHFAVGAVVLPATAKDPQRIVTTRGTVSDPLHDQVEVFATDGTEQPITPGTRFDVDNLFAAGGDQVFTDERGDGVLVLDGSTLRPIETVAQKCGIRALSVAGSVGVVDCTDGSVIAYS